MTRRALKGGKMMLESVARYMAEHHMITAGDLVVVAVSGGPDSITLLHVLHRLSQRLAIRLHAFHMNHGLRGDESEADARYVEEFAAARGIPVTCVSLQPGKLKNQSGSLQANARTVRYDELRSLASRLGATHIALGHNRDDQAETVMMRLLRGTGVRGLSGIPPVRVGDGLTYIRPLLAVPRSEIEAYCLRNGLAPRLDRSNLSTDYLRNRIRLELLPQLAVVYNPTLSENLAQMATLLRDEDQYLDRLAHQELAKCRLPGEGTLLSGAVLQSEPVALARRIVRLAAQEAAGASYDLGLKAVNRVMAAAAEAHGSQRLDLPDGLQVLGEYGTLRFLSRPEAPSLLPRTEWPIWLDRETVLPELGIRMLASVLHGPLPSPPSGKLVAAYDRERLPGPLSVRLRQAGDRLWPVGIAGSKKVQDLLVDAKVPRSQRDRIPLLVAGDDVLWVIGYRLDRRFLASATSRETILLEVKTDLGEARKP